MLQPVNCDQSIQRRSVGHCCCRNILQATYIVGIIEVIRTITILLVEIGCFANSAEVYQEAYLFGLIIVACGSGFVFVSVAMMFKGVRSSNASIIIPHMIIQGLIIGFYFYMFVRNIAYANLSDVIWFFIVFDLIVVITEIYFATVVAKCYKFIRIGQRNSATSSLPVQYILPPAYSNENNHGNSYQPAILNVPPPPLYETLDFSKFGAVMPSQNDKLYV